MSGGARHRESTVPAGRLGASVVILAGGRSSRFGGPKLAAELDGRPLLDHVVELARALSDDVVVALPADAAAVGADPAAGGARAGLPPEVRTVRDPVAFGGPLVGLASALDVIDREVVIVLGGDMPRLRVELVEPMVIVLGSSPDVDAVVLEREGAARPLPLVGRTEALRVAARQVLEGGGEPSLRAAIGLLSAHAIEEDHWRPLDRDDVALADVDRPDDLERLRGRRPEPRR